MRYPLWVNGSEGGCINPADRGLAYGDGLFETLRVEKGRAIFLHEHLQRLQQGAQALGIPCDDGLGESFRRFLATVPACCVAKIILTRGCSSRGYLPDPAAAPTVVFSAHEPPSAPAVLTTDGIKAAVCAQRLAKQPLLAGIKHLNRLEQVLLRRELAMLAADEAVVLDSDGHVIEGVFSNLFFVRRDTLCTPRLDHCGVRGVMRGAILDEAGRQGLAVRQGRYVLDDLRAADEVFFCNSVNGIWPVRRLEGQDFATGPLARRMQVFWQERLDGA